MSTARPFSQPPSFRQSWQVVISQIKEKSKPSIMIAGHLSSQTKSAPKKSECVSSTKKLRIP